MGRMPEIIRCKLLSGKKISFNSVANALLGILLFEFRDTSDFPCKICYCYDRLSSSIISSSLKISMISVTAF